MLKKRLAHLRKEKNLNQEELAKIIGVARTTYAMYEQGHRSPDYETLNRIADFYDVDADFLLGRTDNPKSSSDDFDSLTEIKKIVDDLGVQDLFFNNIDDWKNLTPEDVEELRQDMEYIMRKARRRKEKEDK
ncbi:helix-turn-helix domain-containing protein [Lentibacillus jeotgali]|uniref:helix-turn-helix domain-containing protein n=1 Tax=Lentibacillus jeotgali TaxID=558169 RepID=UPI000262886A|nr:helix-turn-helix transcriptional regulator [Lentibacillus jeotgali]